MIGYRDFVPRQLPQSLLRRLVKTEYETLDDAVAAANDWIAAESVTLVNIETVVLPNIWRMREQGPEDVDVLVSSGWANWHQFIRVWYRLA
jgi:hypothetical protein